MFVEYDRHTAAVIRSARTVPDIERVIVQLMMAHGLSSADIETDAEDVFKAIYPARIPTESKRKKGFTTICCIKK
jgi:hypothetical protein